MNTSLLRTYEALNPERSVIVDACAGTGKTWLLVSRIIRLLLDNVPPNQIVAITFTRKAASEMQVRLREWSHQLAFEHDSWVIDFLVERGITHQQISNYLPRARKLYQNLMAQPGVVINTFDEWFLSLIKQAPLSSSIQFDVNPGIDRLSIRQEAWLSLLKRIELNNDHAEINNLIKKIGTESLRQILFEGANWRVEWQLFTQHNNPKLVWEKIDFEQAGAINPQDMMNDSRVNVLALALIQQLTQLTPALQRQAQELSLLISTSEQVLDFIEWTFTQEGYGTPRQNIANALNAVQQNQLWLDWVDLMERYREGVRLEFTRQLNLQLFTCLDAYIQELIRLKKINREADFSDIAYWIYQLLRDPIQAPHWFYRLDTRFQQVLVDEFQDTSPLQWHILKQWFVNARESDSSLRLFIVGDPKQAIYRFRRSDSRVFEEAKELLLAQYDALQLTLSQSYRSYQGIINLVNRLFENKSSFPHVAHQAKNNTDKGLVKLIVDKQNRKLETNKKAYSDNLLRHPLKTAREEYEMNPTGAMAVAHLLNDSVGKRDILTGQGKKTLEYSDILILARRRQTLIEFEEVFRDLGIPFISQQKGQLLFFLEIEDILSLLKVLVYPMDNLSLAKVLKSPVFNRTDTDLLRFSQDLSWWHQLSSISCFNDVFLLLDHWRKLSQQVPVHDLLETILIEGKVLQSYQACLSFERYYQAQSNIDAFLEFTLSWNSGRYPNLVRFLMEMDELRNDESQAPDQGMLSATTNAVKLMTIHGAKGLEAPMVWLVDHDGWRAKGKSHFWYVNWLPEHAYPDYFSYVPEKKMIPKTQLFYLDREEALLQQEENNLLYVAMTRAQSELYILGGVEEKETAWIKELINLKNIHPDLLIVEEYQ
ncbi:ATP-dependent helicase/nuclease subunit A [Ferrovum sp. PN-J185]|nr:ATP-dependent helicase/nuclease subunit A [Ferrovum sp. PN-J185]